MGPAPGEIPPHGLEEGIIVQQRVEAGEDRLELQAQRGGHGEQIDSRIAVP